MKKWSLRILVSIVALLLLLAAAVQVVLWTDLPQNWVLAALQEKLQLRISAQHFSTGWSGHTQLSGVTVSLPLADEDLLQAQHLSVEHTSLLGLLFGKPLRVEGLTIDKPNLLVRQQPDGRWNVEAAAELLRRTSGGKTPETQERTTVLPQLPAVTVNDAIVRLIDVQGHQATLSPLDFKGAPDGTLVWSFNADIPGQLHLAGQVAPGGAWQHEAKIELANLAPVVRPFLSNPSPATLNMLNQFKLAGKWSGHVSGSLAGRLDFSNLHLAGYTATGPLAVSFNDGGSGVTKLTPTGIVITPPPAQQLPRGRIEAGTIAIDGQNVSGTGLTVALAGGELRLAGHYGWKAGEGALESSWINIALPPGTLHGGALTASVRQPWPNQPMIDVALTSNGRMGTDTWTTALKLDGAGKAWDQVDWKLIANTLSYQHARQTYNLDKLTATLATRGKILTLDTLSIPAGTLYGKFQRGMLGASGRYDFSTGVWNAYLSGTGWPVVPGARKPADFIVNASGSPSGAHLEQFFFDGKELRLWANGDVSYAKGTPVELYVFGWYPPVSYTWQERGEGERENIRLAGHLWSELLVKKNAWPLDLNITGTLYGKDFTLKNHVVGDVAIKLNGHAGPEHVHIGTTKMELLGGIWDLDADLRYQNWFSRIGITLEELPLAQLDDFAAPPPNLRGKMSSQLYIEIPDFDANRMTAAGDYRIKDLGYLKSSNKAPAAPAKVASLDKPVGGPEEITASHVEPSDRPPLVVVPRVPVKPRPATVQAANPQRMPATAPVAQKTTIPIADVVKGNITIKDGVVTLDPLRLERTPPGGTEGITIAKVSFPTFSPRQVHVEANIAAWQLTLQDTRTNELSNVHIWGGTKGLDIDLKHLIVDGPFKLDATIAIKDQTIGLHVDSQFAQRRLLLNSLTGDGLGGDIYGYGVIDFDHPLESQGEVQWNNVDAESIITLAPSLKGLGGKYSGTFRFSPTDYSTDRDATGPFAFSGEFWSNGGHWKGISLGNAYFIAHANYHAATKSEKQSARAVVDRLDWDLAGGNMKGWSRVTWYDLEPFLQVNLSFDNLNLDPLVRATRPAGQPHKTTPGHLSGNLMAAGNPFSERGQQAASGEAKIRLTDSDLVNVQAVNLLYSIMSVQLGPPKPTGRGFIQARLEGKRLEIPAMHYFNRGADIWANAAIVDLFKGSDSPIEGTAAGSIKPLRDLKLPFMADIDKIISALSGSVATVSIQGSVGDPVVKVIPFAESGDTFRRFMVGEVKNEVRGTSGR
jgi:hypothetical protein